MRRGGTGRVGALSGDLHLLFYDTGTESCVEDVTVTKAARRRKWRQVEWRDGRRCGRVLVKCSTSMAWHVVGAEYQNVKR